MDDALSYHDTASYHEHPSQRLDAMRRTVAKALNSSGHNSSFYSSDLDEAGPHPHPHPNPNPNPKVEELVKTILFALMRQSTEYLKQPEGEAAMASFVELLARAMSREPVKVAIRGSAQEVTSGLWDGCHRKLDEAAMKVPRVLLGMGVLAAGTYGALLAAGLVLSLWRFSLYGLGQEKNIWYTST